MINSVIRRFLVARKGYTNWYATTTPVYQKQNGSDRDTKWYAILMSDYQHQNYYQNVDFKSFPKQIQIELASLLIKNKIT